MVLLLVLTATSLTASAGGYRLIVNRDNPTVGLTRERLAALYLKKSTTWEGGEEALPVDLPEASETRAAFSVEVLKKSVAGVKAYWNQQIFSGRSVPPREQPGDAEVVAYVKAHANAVGYVSEKADVSGVKVVTFDEAETISDTVSMPTAIQRVNPVYPSAARAGRRQATVELSATVDATGRVVGIEPRGPAAGYGFDEAAREAAQRTTFRPGTRDGRAVQMQTVLQYRFVLQ